MNNTGFPCLEGYDAWIDMRRNKRSACELMVSIEAKQAKIHHAKGYFWLEFTAPDKSFMGWMRFDFQQVIKNQAIFAAAEWRPANTQAPALKDVLLPSSVPQQAGIEYAR
ncbi:hypothetical protein [Methylomonas rapida]|uniref:Uncharacterized protein n=1 Tax=Methylomonas rapida TaxID=2963939 RepID=A0ABY7GIE9_9GAMM|nr:hypothetical protein [Methylomonas rapida]WAR43623.1 hypothetical protein NM686_014710 [Methylomonas rapida]